MLLLLVVLAAIYGGCSKPHATVYTAKDAVTPSGPVDFSKLAYWGFDLEKPKTEADKAAKRGLENLYAGLALGMGNSIPIPIALKLQELMTGAKTPPPTDPLTAFRQVGAMPSPPHRPEVGVLFITKRIPNIGDSAVMKDFWGSLVTFTANCFTCHSGVASGTVIAGLYNSHIDYVPGHASQEALVRFDPQLMEYAKQLDPDGSKGIVKQYSIFRRMMKDGMPMSKFAQARGENFGMYPVWMNIAQLKDPERTGLIGYDYGEEAPMGKYVNGKELVPAEANPWFLRKYKRSRYRYMDRAPNEAAGFTFNFSFFHPDINKKHPEHVQIISEVLAFAEQTTSPPFPGALNAAKVEKGRALFHGEMPIATGGELPCANCHGTYTRLKAGADLSKPGAWLVDYQEGDVRDVGTDPAYNELLRSFKPLLSHLEKTKVFFKDTPKLAPYADVPEKPGYLAPPLVGLWASAPYFHNGSVPTVYQVLNSKKRAQFWKRTNSDPFSYDLDHLGLTVESSSITTEEAYLAKRKAIASQDVFSAERLEFRRIYNTGGHGRRNGGHTFGDAMSEEERMAVIEFLKSLSGPDMPSMHANPKPFIPKTASK